MNIYGLRTRTFSYIFCACFGRALFCACLMFVLYIPLPSDSQHCEQCVCVYLASILTVTTTMPPRGGTAWTSDRIRLTPQKPSAHLVAQTPSKSDKGKGRASTPKPPRSAAVRKLDELLTDLRSSSSRTPNIAQDGCFCQGNDGPS